MSFEGVIGVRSIKGETLRNLQLACHFDSEVISYAGYFPLRLHNQDFFQLFWLFNNCRNFFCNLFLLIFFRFPLLKDRRIV
jgi:hypothetical protein